MQKKHSERLAAQSHGLGGKLYNRVGGWGSPPATRKCGHPLNLLPHYSLLAIGVLYAVAHCCRVELRIFRLAAVFAANSDAVVQGKPSPHAASKLLA